MPEPAACPVCAEPLPDRPERCFRCETALAAWWPFEESLLAASFVVAPPATASAAARPTLAWARWAAAFLLLAAVVVLLRRPIVHAPASPTPETRPVATAPRALPPIAPSPAVVVYRVQRGDSLWRIAAAFTGDGRRWRELWPQAEGRPLVPGTVLEVPASRLPPEPLP